VGVGIYSVGLLISDHSVTSVIIICIRKWPIPFCYSKVTAFVLSSEFALRLVSPRYSIVFHAHVPASHNEHDELCLYLVCRICVWYGVWGRQNHDGPAFGQLDGQSEPLHEVPMEKEGDKDVTKDDL
jgi:hypothetical protein